VEWGGFCVVGIGTVTAREGGCTVGGESSRVLRVRSRVVIRFVVDLSLERLVCR